MLHNTKDFYMKPTYEQVLQQLKIINYKLGEALNFGAFEEYQSENIQRTVNQAAAVITLAEQE